MSIQAIAWVLDHSRAEGIDRLVLIALANHADHETGRCDPGYRRIAHEANCSVMTVGRAVDRLAELGEVAITRRGVGRATNKYHLPWLAAGLRSVTSRSDTTAPVASHSETHSVTGETHSVTGETHSVTPLCDESLQIRIQNRAQRRAPEGGAALPGAANPTRSVAEILADLDATPAAPIERAEAHAETIRDRLPPRSHRPPTRRPPPP